MTVHLTAAGDVIGSILFCVYQFIFLHGAFGRILDLMRSVLEKFPFNFNSL